ncbi:sigma-54-dependent Fis family transcriptional regulator [Rhodoferax sp. GW822-FHT02A01]|uniref:sigma-54-dependent Fis family transcriptional regulator n=1 Tax=Rhodoferax sp. GW822-FHT02A01 TaxID=3141537 RepID=UPI00315CD247
MKHSTPTPVLRQARQHLIEHGTPLPGTVNERLWHSWQRSLAAGLLPMGRLTATDHAADSELRQSLARNHELLAHSRPVMEYLFEQVRHIQNVVILADSRGTLMHTLGDPFFLSKAERVSLTAGASWREEHRGTNAIGTAIAEESPVEIHGAEHFLERNGFLTCAAAPIMSSCGNVIGILDISGEQHSGHPMTLGLVSTAARMIENRLMIATSKRHLRIHMHARAEGIGTVAEGIATLSDDGWIIGANRQALSLLRMNAKAIGATQLGSVLDVRLSDLLTRHRQRPAQALQVHLHDGTTLFVQMQADAAALPPQILVPASAAPAVAKDALTALDTGDLQWRGAADKARRVLDKPIPVLIQGESGVGKEYFARAMHDSSKRASGPFVAINCAAIPENLIEAELFGYAPGAFTGARKEGSLGKLREANGGTLFLDEIGDMPLSMQTRLLRVLQERSVVPLGGSKSIAVDFALVCATHCNLREAASRGAFRSDLYYRINGLTVQLPALRERTDFQALAERLLAGLHPQRAVHLQPQVLDKMSQYAWPGNLRQCASVLRTACAMLDDDESSIEFKHLPDDIVEDLLAPQTRASQVSEVREPHNLQELSRYAVKQALEASRGNISLAARTLGISRQTLYRKMQAQ